MTEEIGTLAGAIWRALDAKGGMTLSQLKKEVNGKPFIFECAVGWLAREDNIVLEQVKKSYRIQLRNGHAQAANAA